MKTSGTLGRYMVGRFTTTIMGVFLLMLILIFFIDFVEVLRQGSKRDDIGPGTLALISVLRIPIFAELAFPFAVLIGTIGAYMALSRSSELTIVRAAGVSVWQFLKPSLFVGMALGVLAVTVYNPAASAMKAELERIQTSPVRQSERPSARPRERGTGRGRRASTGLDFAGKNNCGPRAHTRRRYRVAI